MRFQLPATLLRAAGGVAIGVFFLWLAVHNTDVRAVWHLAHSVRLEWVWAALVLYIVDLAVRIRRWQVLLGGLASAPLPVVGEVLMVGYAVNNLLPARLGEVFRADYAKRRFGISRAAALGSIVVERLLDAILVVMCLAVGLIALGAFDARGSGGNELVVLKAVLTIGVIVMAGAAAAIVAGTAMKWTLVRLPDRLVRLLRDLTAGLRTLRGPAVLPAVGLTLVVWVLEAAALWCIARAVGADLSLFEMLVLIGAVSLSTLVPTAPGYVGTYQYVFALVLAAFGYQAAAGVVAGTLVQVFLFGFVAVTGISLYLGRVLHGAMERLSG